MTRTPALAARGAAAVILSLAVLGSEPAFAQASPSPSPSPSIETEPVRSPVIDRAPRRVRYLRNAVIRGRLRGGVGGDRVALQRRGRDGTWRTLARKAVTRDSNRLRFRLRDLRRSAAYRLRWQDPGSDRAASSGPRRIAVRARLRARLSRRHALAGRTVRVRGRLRPRAPGRRVLVSKRVDGRWRLVGRPRVRRGRFRTSVLAGPGGRRPIRVRFRRDAQNAGARDGKLLRVYRPSLATWYGPGFYGNRTACGRILRTTTVGVAHRTLPCGTKVSILYGGRAIRVPVIDRGPYSSARWDLTSRTAQLIGFSGRNTIGIMR